MNRGKKAQQWDKVRAELKREFECNLQITWCEQCGGTFALSFAHRLKRRYITDNVELRQVALLCQKCHETIEHSGHDNMFEAVTAIIDSRTLD